jgi:hypothetical protein
MDKEKRDFLKNGLDKLETLECKEKDIIIKDDTT